MTKKTIKKHFKFWTPVFLLLALTIYVIFRISTAQSPDILLLDQIAEDDWVKGKPDAQIVLIEYSDFQCPACAQYHFLVKDLIEEFGSHVAFSFRHFPLKSIHPFAFHAARAAEAAGNQDKFWEMSDMLFGNQAQWASASKNRLEEIFTGYAREIGLDAEKFIKDLNSKETENKVEKDLISAQNNNLNYTPSFFLNGELINNPRSYDEFRNLLKAAIQESS